MSKGWMHILKCAFGIYYTGRTKNLEFRLAQHQAVEVANHTKKHLPVKLVYFEEYERIDGEDLKTPTVVEELEIKAKDTPKTLPESNDAKDNDKIKQKVNQKTENK
ncbi:MAG: GIY-YIG nuclease family protein [Candidatus Kapabacteria bacterium]|nr:GIY-YIG nuclease family protein [Candidatus Kapabacteria bacterium]